ncbi:MAG: hypothetical protein F6K31_32570 [Symploca sp. SIO2G7]|nr:hypothetical protein [Symploca sp. SIO2G7]
MATAHLATGKDLVSSIRSGWFTASWEAPNQAVLLRPRLKMISYWELWENIKRTSCQIFVTICNIE